MHSIDQQSADLTAVLRTDLPLPGRREGKVRDIYDVSAADGRDAGVLIIATDRISAFDVVMPTAVPGKGSLLTDISVRWFEFVQQTLGIPHHLQSTTPDSLTELSDEQRASITGRMMMGRAASVIPIECVVRGYLAGSGWKEYQQSQTVCGIPLPAGIEFCGRLPEPILTPTSKDDVHDEPITLTEARVRVGDEVFERAHAASLALFARGSSERGSSCSSRAATTSTRAGTGDSVRRLRGRLQLSGDANQRVFGRLIPITRWKVGRTLDVWVVVGAAGSGANQLDPQFNE